MKFKALFAAFLLFSFSAQAEERFNLGVSVDEISGVAYENVYDGQDKISELVWEIQDLHMATIHFQIPVYDKLRFRTSYGQAVDRGASDATMVDSDWISDYGYSNGNTDYNNWTHRSWSRVEMVNANNFDANLSYNFIHNFHFNLGYKQTYFKWRDYGGDYVYSDVTFRDTVGNFNNATGIVYSQTMQIPYIGLEYEQPLFNKKFLVNLSGAYSNMVRAEDKDQHLMRSLVFTDTFKGGEYYNLGAKLEYFFTNNFSLGFGYEYNQVKEIIGDTKIVNVDTGASGSCLDCAGFSNEYEKYSLFMRYFFSGVPNLFNF